MAKTKKAFLSRITAFVLSITLIIGLIPANLISVLATTPTGKGTLSCITEGGTVTNADEENATATFGDVTLDWREADPSVGITQDGWWVGVKMTAPTDMTKLEDFTSVTYQKCISSVEDTWSTAASFWDDQDSDKSVESAERYLTMWGMVNEQNLNDAIVNGSTVNFTWRFDWNGDGEYEQKALLKVDPKKIKLNKDEVQIYPSTTGNGKVSAISDGLSVEGVPFANYVKVIYTEDTVMNWIAADPSVGRVQDGWWSGIKMTAPANFKTESDFANVTLQVKSNDTWSEAKKFWDYKDSADSAEEHFVGLWALLNAAKLRTADGNVEYMWRFDWDGDKVYEQIVELEVAPKRITLKDKDGVQVYPELGSVDVITGGEVAGNKTKEVIVNVGDIELAWSKKDTSIGKDQDGWWVGATITAPESIVLTKLNDVKYRVKKYGDDAWSDALSFYMNQNSVKDSAVHYMQLWTVLDRTSFEKAKAEGKNITSQWEFDWDKDGKYDQCVTLNIVTATTTLKRLNRELKFTETSENKQVWKKNTSYNVVAVSKETPDAKVIYSITQGGEFAAINADTGVLTFDNSVDMGKDGKKVTVSAKVAQDDVYNEATAQLSFTVKNGLVAGFKVEKPANIVYGENGNKYENEAYSSKAVKYAVTKGDAAVIEDETKPVLTIVKAGTVTVTAYQAGANDTYSPFKTYTLTIEKADQKDFAFADDAPTGYTYSETPYNLPEVVGYKVASDKITYAVTAGKDVADIVDDKLETYKKGDFTLAVSVPGDDCYNAATIERVMRVSEAAQESLEFKQPFPANVVYNENNNKFENEAVGGKSSGKITYKVDSSTVEGAVVIEDKNSPVITIKKAGTVVIAATRAGDGKFGDETVKYTLTIEKAEQKFTFKDGKEVEKVYGDAEYFNEPVPTVDETKADKVGHGNGAFVYSIEENEIGASIDANTGIVKFTDSDKKVGTVTVFVTREADECYNSFTDSYTLDVKYLDINPTIDELISTKPNENGWYNSEVEISYDGYSVSYSNELSAEWTDKVVYDTEGEVAPVVYLKSAEGGITDAITLNGYKMDSSAPENLTVVYDEKTIWEKIFGFVAGKEAKVTVKAEDSVSGIDYIEYTLNNWETTETIDNFEGSAEITIPAQYRDEVVFKAYDIAGNTAEYRDGKIIVVDNIAPSINAKYDYHSGNYSETEKAVYASENVTLTFELTADNFDLSVKPVVKVDGEEKALEWTTEGTINSASIDFTEAGDYVVEFNFADRLGRVATYTKEIHIDGTAPEIGVELDPENATAGDKYFNTDRKATITIKEHNFDAKDVVANVTAMDVAGNKTEGLEYIEDTDFVKEFREYLQNNDNWYYVDENGELTKDKAEAADSDIHVAVIVFNVDANYTFGIEYSDAAGNKAENYSADEFVIDHTAPTDVKIDYSQEVSFWEEIIEAVTFGFYSYKDELTVTVTADDITSGVDYIKLDYLKQAGASDINADDYSETKLSDEIEYSNGGKTAKATFTIPAQARGHIDVDVGDNAINIAEKSDSNRINIVDNITPTRSVSFTPDRIFDNNTGKVVESFNEGDDVILYYKNSAKVTFTINEANFYSEDVVIKVDDKVVKSADWTQNGDNWTGSIIVDGAGDHIVTAAYTDRSGNAMKEYTAPVIRIDTVAPVIESVIYNPEVATANEKYFNTVRTATITVKESNFLASDVVATVTAKDVEGNNAANVEFIKESDIVKKYRDYLQNNDNWYYVDENGELTKDVSKAVDPDIHVAQITFDADAQYTFELDVKDIAGNEAEKYTAEAFVVDQTNPSNVKIEYSEHINFWEEIIDMVTFGFYSYNEKMDVTVTADDITAGVDYIEYTYVERELTGAKKADSVPQTKLLTDIEYSNNGRTAKATFTIEAQARGNIEVNVVDKATNSEKVEEKRINIVDNVSPTSNVIYTPERVLDKETFEDVKLDEFANRDDVILYYKESAKVTFNIKEANFYPDAIKNADPDGNESTKGIIIKVDGKVVKSEDWVLSGDVWTRSITISEQGDHIVTATYTDRSGNKMQDYTSQEIRIDGTAPVIEVEYEPKKATANGKYFNEDRKAKITITEHNFLANQVVATVTAKDVEGNNASGIEFLEKSDIVKKYRDYLADADNWYYLDKDKKFTKDVNKAENPDVHVAEITFDDDAQYTFDIEVSDIVGNKSEDYEADAFVVDETKPTNINIEYSESIKFWDELLETVTLGYYSYQDELDVTVTADDITSGVDEIKLHYVKQDGASDKNKDDFTESKSAKDIEYSNNGRTAKATFTIPAQARGHIEIEAIDKATNIAKKADSERINVVDNVSPTRTVAYSKAQQIVSAKTLKTRKTYDEGDKVIAYYNSEADVTITVNEANFYSEDTKITVTKNGKPYAVDVAWTDNTVDEHVGTFKLTTQGDYVVNMTYTDRSNNVMKEYTSHLIVIDKQKPVVNVSYENKTKDALNVLKDTEGNSRKYFDKEQSAVITIQEHNFRADDVVVNIKAKDVLGNNVKVSSFTFDKNGNIKEYLAEGSKRAEWSEYTVDSFRREDDTYKMEIEYSADANYTFDIEYKDLANNVAKDRKPDYFTVDKTSPKCTKIDYSKRFYDAAIEAVTFHYYNAPMIVTLTAEDNISGVYHFLYSYLNNEGVSEVNAELINDAIKHAKIVFDGDKTKTNGKTAVVTFKIPRDVLKNNNQFNGFVEFTAFDRSENESKKLTDNDNAIVVDNIKPTFDITYNDHDGQDGSTKYFNEKIDATIVINEANFYKEDVKVTVEKNGANQAQAVTWSDNGDVHTGTFTLNDEAEYIIKVEYADRSGNAINKHTSELLIIDKHEPKIEVKGLKHESANNQETIGFQLIVTDKNINKASIAPTLSAMIKEESADNKFNLIPHTIKLGEPAVSTNADGETVYTYTVKNLEIDGYYSLNCTASDYSHPAVTNIKVEGQNNDVKTMNYSVNRKGSTFDIEVKHNGKAVDLKEFNNIYTNGKVEINIVEINVDKVDEIADKRTVFTLNDGSSSEDIQLVEKANGKGNYVKNVADSKGNGGWFKTTYTLTNEDNFKKDGVYSFNIITYDNAGNSNVNTKQEISTLSFTLDRTSPKISSNISNNKRVSDAEYWVEFEITETNPSGTPVVKLYDNRGKEKATEVVELGNNQYKFLVKSGMNYSVEISAKDLANNESEVYKVEKLTISTNPIILWYANTTLFWGTIGAAVLLGGLLIFVIILKKKKKEER